MGGSLGFQVTLQNMLCRVSASLGKLDLKLFNATQKKNQAHFHNNGKKHTTWQKVCHQKFADFTVGIQCV